MLFVVFIILYASLSGKNFRIDLQGLMYIVFSIFSITGQIK